MLNDIHGVNFCGLGVSGEVQHRDDPYAVGVGAFRLLSDEYLALKVSDRQRRRQPSAPVVPVSTQKFRTSREQQVHAPRGGLGAGAVEHDVGARLNARV